MEGQSSFRVGDIVRPCPGETHAGHTFVILALDPEMKYWRCFSEKLCADKRGHEGGSKYNGKRYGHWNYRTKEIVFVSRPEGVPEPVFEIGDTVRAIRSPFEGEIFQILHVSDTNIVAFSQELCDAREGHAAGGSGKGNGQVFGHWNFDYHEIELIKSKQVQHKQHEVSGSDSDSPRGVTTRIHSSKCTLASGGRFVGTPATNFKLKGRLAKGTVKHNVQSHGLC